MQGKGKKSTNLYLEILGLKEPVNKHDIKRAYRIQIKKWHPDTISESDERYKEATERCKLINEAYENLENYDSENIDSGIKKTSNEAEQKTKFSQEPGINRVRVKSSNIHSIGYDEKTKVLQIEFLNGGIYEYYDVPFEIYFKLINAKSKGRFASQHIYYNYRYRSTK